MNRFTTGRLARTLGLGAALLAAGCGKHPTTPHLTLPDADSLAVNPDTATVVIGASYRFTVAAFDSAGVTISANLHFASSDPAVFAVDPSGRVTGRGEGSAVLSVVSGAARDSAGVIVIAAQRGWFTLSSGVATHLNGVFVL